MCPQILIRSVALLLFIVPLSARAQQRFGSLRADRILFMGNSLTLHGPKADIGWSGHWGMYASAADRDFVHQLTSGLQARSGIKLALEPVPATGHGGAENIINIAQILEREYRSFDASKIRRQLDWKADLVVLQFGENVPRGDFDPIAFEKALKALLAELKQASNPQIFITSQILSPNSPLDDIKKKACAEDPQNRTFVDISYFSGDKTLFGKLGHPNDAGMARIAATLLAAISAKAGVNFSAVEPVPVFTPGAKILFQGDSITDGNRGRSADPNHILGHGYVYLIAARHGAAFPEMQLDFMNRGISGNTVLDLQKRWQKETLDLKPDVLSVLIGVNDSGRKVPLEIYESTYESLLTTARAANPKLKLVLCLPFQLDARATAPANGSPYADIVKRQTIVRKLAAKYGAAVVDFQQALDDACRRAPAAYWIWDGVHPTTAGHQILADAWESAVRRHFGGGQ